jgi:pantoate--beta-alanine ligase
MKTISSIEEMQFFSTESKHKNLSIAFVPTMGFLHEGHLSLIENAKKYADIVVVSIFVNSKQFAENEDFGSYPRDLKRDSELCEDKKVDILFIPEVDEMYPNDFSSTVKVSGIDNHLCGISRPDHFEGVTIVVAKLFNIVRPDTVIFGQKDYQQCLIVQKMIKDLNFPINLIISPIIREVDGLAKSSRNKYLNEDQRKQATSIYRSLCFAEKQMKEDLGDIDKIYKEITNLLKSNDAEIDYVEFKNAEDLSPFKHGNKHILLAIAVRFGTTRLIDNIIIEV